MWKLEKEQLVTFSSRKYHQDTSLNRKWEDAGISIPLTLEADVAGGSSASTSATPGKDTVLLRDVKEDDLRAFFERQLDPVANDMAAFTAKDPAEREAFDAHWRKILANDAMIKKSIVRNDLLIGYVVSFEQSGRREISYWIAREQWGKGFATKALAAFLSGEKRRPIYARAAKDNIALLRVLEKSGFTICGHDKGFANARGEEIEELVLVKGEQ